MGKIIGIDLASTASVVACVINGKPEVIPNANGNRITPSVVCYDGNDFSEIKVGETAKRKIITSPKNTIELVKRFMGATFSETKKYHSMFNYDIVEGPNDSVRIKVGDKLLTPQEISAEILRCVKRDAESYLGEKIEDAVITVPAYYNDANRQAVIEAGKIAGINVKRIINEPTAACLVYGVDKENIDNLLVIDSGASTTDFSILNVQDSVFEVIGTNGDKFLGGRDIDQVIVNKIVEDCKKEFGYDVSKDNMAYSRIVEASEKAKIELSSAQSTEINLPYLGVQDGVPMHYVKTMMRSEFEKLIKPIAKKTMALVDDLFEKTKMSKNDIKDVLFVGGTSRIPAMKVAVEKYFDNRIKITQSVNPDEAIALGAAIQGSILAGDNPNDVLLLDVISTNLGVETVGGIFSVVVPANTTIPVSKTIPVSTAVDSQTEIAVNVISGFGSMVTKRGSDVDGDRNRSIGQFVLGDIAPAKRGVPKLEVKFDVDVNGVLMVTATNTLDGKNASIKIEGSSNLSDEEIAKMKADAEAHELEDNARVERQTKINQTESLINSVDNLLSENGDKLSDDIKSELSDKLEALKLVFNVDDKERNFEEVDNAFKILEEVTFKASSELYKNVDNPSDSTQQGGNPFDEFGHRNS